MGKAKLANKRREVDIGTEALDLANELGNAALLGHARPSDDEIIDVLTRVQDNLAPDKCEDCEDAKDSITRFADHALGDSVTDNLTSATNALVTVLGHSELRGSECEDIVEAFKSTVLRETAIKWVAERAADLGQPDLAASIVKLEAL